MPLLQEFQELVWEFPSKMTLIPYVSSMFSKCGVNESRHPTSLHMTFDYIINQIYEE